MEGDDKVDTDNQKNRQNRRTEKIQQNWWFNKIVEEIEMGDNQNKEKI